VCVGGREMERVRERGGEGKGEGVRERKGGKYLNFLTVQHIDVTIKIDNSEEAKRTAR
jgi:hypothetical protein